MGGDGDVHPNFLKICENKQFPRPLPLLAPIKHCQADRYAPMLKQLHVQLLGGSTQTEQNNNGPKNIRCVEIKFRKWHPFSKFAIKH